MTGEYELLKKVLSTIEFKEGLNKDNIIKELKTKLEKQDQGLYKEWEKDEFDVNHGFSLNISGIEYSKLPLLIIAARNGYTKTVEVLLGVGADINEKDSFSCTALCHAALFGRKEIVEFLISKGADVNAKGIFGCTVLHNAALCGCKEIVEFLTSKGADVDAKDVFGRTALHYAALCGRKEIVEFLISKKADVDAKDSSNRTALHYAALCGRKEIVEFLISKKADVDAKDSSNRTALHYAAFDDHTNITKSLLRIGADFDVDEPLLYAAFDDHTKIIKALLRIGADFDVDEPLLLHNDDKNGRVGIVGILLQEGTNVNAVDKYGKTPLHHAAKNGHVDIVNALIKAGADVNAVDKYGKTPLDYAKNQDVVKALLDAGGRSFVKARNKAMIAGGVNTLLGTAIAVALFTTGIITAELIPIVIAVVAVTAAALVVGCATYELLKPSTKVDGAEKSSAALINGQQGVTSIPS
ncbi:ankyrin repeat domain-containing protein [Wolbachia endosymbiont (group B) of Philonthus cognatus]|uniref:ankyrin repeat domain-containing protein n=1 Tax=Wolbachia endosymbiont (group B) of Philonthus cognatus TaxID=2954047 RepID=UPI0022205D19|nr:ankyrin repeat domain-containing protein [Wolbachia endosymbiont (group B) of Philonthus cognatus]